jgi:hypothetical protein
MNNILFMLFNYEIIVHNKTHIITGLLICKLIIIMFKITPFIYLYNKQKIDNLFDFFYFISKHNPLLLDYTHNEDEIKDEATSKIDNISYNVNTYETKYLQKFKTFPNEFKLTQQEINDEVIEYNNIKLNYTVEKTATLNELHQKLAKIEEIENKGGINVMPDNNNKRTTHINRFGIDSLLEYYYEDDEGDENECDIDFEELYDNLLTIKNKLMNELKNETENMCTDDDFRLQAHDFIINKRLDTYIDNYILEHTPLGNVYVRYNNDKKSFEYFSNNTIPYRFLEPLGRKYVMTYWCKPIFIDIEEELIAAEKKYDVEKEEQKTKENQNKKVKNEDITSSKKSILAKLKGYNKDVMTSSSNSLKYPSKNRSVTNFILPSQVNTNLTDNDQKTNKHLLKNANRYTWEGRLSDFSPLKKQRTTKLNLTYAEFKKQQQK